MHAFYSLFKPKPQVGTPKTNLGSVWLCSSSQGGHIGYTAFLYFYHFWSLLSAHLDGCPNLLRGSGKLTGEV